MKMVVIVDYGMGNLDSVARAVEECGGNPKVTCNPADVAEAERIILPGVGAFGTGMKNIRERGLEGVLRERVIGSSIPLLGICLGMQLLANKGWESGETPGLAWIPGEVKRLQPDGPGTRIPHMGWNEVVYVRSFPLFQGIPSSKDFYFVHSFHLICDSENDVLARTPYCGGFVSAVSRGNIFGVQFHPEKSQRLGFQVLRNFLAL